MGKGIFAKITRLLGLAALTMVLLLMIDVFSSPVNDVMAQPNLKAPAATPIPITDGLGLYNPTTSKFYLTFANSGSTEEMYKFGPAGAGWQPVTGDWDGSEDLVPDTAGLYNKGNATWYLRKAHSGGPADLTFRFGPAGMDWIPLAGDWEGDSTYTTALYNPATSKWYIKFSNSSGSANLVYKFGCDGGGWMPIVGDWDGDGDETSGMYNPATSKFYLRNSLTGGVAEVVFRYGPGGAGWLPIVGDWNCDGTDTIGLYNPATSKFYLRNSNSGGLADEMVKFGPAGLEWQPISGAWG